MNQPLGADPSLDAGGTIQAYRLPHHQEQAGSEESKQFDPNDYYWALTSERPVEDTAEFAPLVQSPPETRANMESVPKPWNSVPYPPRALPPRLMAPYGAPMPPQLPPPSFFPPRPATPPWLAELLSFSRGRPPALESLRFGSEERIAQIRETCDMLAVSLLRMCNSIQCIGDIESKIMLSRQSPPNELKEMWHDATLLAQETFEAFPPYLASISKTDLDQVNIMLRPQPRQPCSAPAILPSAIESSSLPSSMSLPQSIVQLPSSAFLTSMGAMSAPCPSSSTAALNCPYSTGLFSGCSDHCLAGEYIATNPPHSFYHGSAIFAPPSSFSFAPFASNFARGPPLTERRRASAPDLALDPYASPTAQLIKKNLSIGDRPLTPPAHGWHAKYSSGVTGVVWDRVHQAWVVSWTLAGKRTFRHFTCKSYGGFDKARDAAIEFRLARNRDIAAYNRRCKDRRG